MSSLDTIVLNLYTVEKEVESLDKFGDYDVGSRATIGNVKYEYVFSMPGEGKEENDHGIWTKPKLHNIEWLRVGELWSL